jgi:ribosomal protein S18 acetylase RimI-like enzyme
VIRVVPAQSEESLSNARNLFGEYARTPGVVACLEDFEREVAALPGRYAPPGGRLLLAMETAAGIDEQAIACVALRQLDQDSCEMKRLYVRPASRGKGAARELVRSLITEARAIGYERMVLDTLPSMKEAHELYRALGFREIDSYQKNPIPGALFFELRL